MKEAGATAFVAATAIFKNPQGIEAGIRSLRNVIAPPAVGGVAST